MFGFGAIFFHTASNKAFLGEHWPSITFVQPLFFFLAPHPSQKKQLANKARYRQLCIGSKENEAYNQILQSQGYHLDGSFGNFQHFVAIVEYIYNFDD